PGPGGRRPPGSARAGPGRPACRPPRTGAPGAGTCGGGSQSSGDRHSLTAAPLAVPDPLPLLAPRILPAPRPAPEAPDRPRDRRADLQVGEEEVEEGGCVGWEEGQLHGAGLASSPRPVGAGAGVSSVGRPKVRRREAVILRVSSPPSPRRGSRTADR